MAESENCNGSSQLELERLKLSELLERGWKSYEEVDASQEPLASTAVQVQIKRSISMLEEASRQVAQLELFSRNEELEEVSTSHLRYLLLPALLGALHMKLTGRETRLQIIQIARVYFLDYLRRCNDYSICQVQLPKQGREDSSEDRTPKAKSAPAGASDLVSMATHRQSKIERYRQRKEVEARLSDVKRLVESGEADEEVSRDFYLLNIRRWVSLSLEEVESIDQEVEILKNMDVLKLGSSKQPTRQPLKSFILTRDAVQSQVFGVGYPSLPSMTVDEWYEQHAQHGHLPDQGGAIPDKAVPQRSADEEDSQDEEETDESVEKARKWDDYKDNHRRGYGNRHNMG